MKTITEVSKITGIIPQRINDYEKAGLLEKPAARNKYKYRLYSDKEIVRLWQIRFYKELGYTIPQMKRIFSDPGYRVEDEIREQIRLLEEKKRQIDTLLLQAKALQKSGLDLSVSYDIIPSINQFTYDEAAEFAFPLWSKSILAASEEAEADEDEADEGIMDDLTGILDLLKNGSTASGETVQRCLQNVKQGHKIPIASIRLMLELPEVKEEITEAYGEKCLQAFQESLQIAGRTEATEITAQAEQHISVLLNMKGESPESMKVQEQVTELLRCISFGMDFPETPGKPKQYEIEAIESIIQQYGKRDSAFYTSIYRRRISLVERKSRSGKVAEADLKEAAAAVDYLYSQAEETLVPALKAYYNNMKKACDSGKEAER